MRGRDGRVRLETLHLKLLRAERRPVLLLQRRYLAAFDVLAYHVPMVLLDGFRQLFVLDRQTLLRLLHVDG